MVSLRKDTNELFTMPDDVQINDDYSERVKKPGDFATLRQKHKDGMYQTLEQFESDVYMVFRKAITSNATDSIPHREALYSIECSTSCTEQRRCTYRLGSDSSEPIFPMVSRQPTQLIYNNGAPSYKASLMHFVKDAGLLARRAAANKCQEYAQREKSLSVPLQQTPYTLTDKNSSFPTFCSWSRNPNSGTDSAVSSAAMATCFLPAIARFFGDSCLPSSNTNEKEPTIFSGMDCSSLGVNDMLDPGLVGGPNRKLETNELLRLFSLIGTPQFLERSKITLASNSSKVTKPDQSFNSFLSGEGAHTVTTEEPKQVVLSSMIQTGQCWRLEQTRRTSMSNLPSWKSQLSELKPLGQKRLAGPEPCLRLASKTSSSITLGFSEYASSGHPFRQSTLNQFRSPK
ncbi:putative Bromodomain-containing protein 1 [Cocos nucifera]|uniref:Putative Bromodomain-containing protein 1 n=1 Tax=Cocos nucifera TaxID=13894 RepID=A0A8K0IZI7_COCNU|nr:putative Bromodomain-containing protein 1 [Cocos nucifera]